jgi:two-component system invasion response regulator UvrY
MPEVLIADDHVIVRRGLRNLLHEHVRPSSIQEVTSCADLMQHLRRDEPDLLILDLQLSDGNAMDVLESIRKEHPSVRILVHTMSPEWIYAQRVLDLGGSGFVNKQANEEEVLKAILLILRGKAYRSHELQMRMLETEHIRDADGVNPFKALSDRELSVMHELLAGRGVKEVAGRLGLQPTTVATYKARLFDKLAVGNILELQRLWEANGSQQ